MLRALRDGAKTGFLKYILLGLLVLAAGGLVLTDVGGFFSGGGVSNNFVAKGKSIKISTMEFDRSMRRVLARQGISAEEAYNLGFVNQILSGEVQTQIMSREARKMGVVVSDELIMDNLAQMAEPFAQEGQSKKDVLTSLLRNQGISENEFIESVRQEMGNNLFRSALVSGAESLSGHMANDLYQYQNEIRDVQGFTLMNKNAPDVGTPTDEDLQTYYETNKSDFLISEKRSVTLATLKKEMLADKVVITDDELRQVYDEDIESYKRPERRKVQQAILDRQADAQDVVKRVNKGSSLKKSVNRVTGNETPYLGESEFERGGMLQDVAEPVFSAGENDVIGPIQTPLGWHVIVLKSITEPYTQSFDEVKANIKDALLQTAAEENLIETANMIDDRLAGGEELESVVTEVGLTTQSYKGFNQSGMDESAKDLFRDYQGDRAQILEAAFDFDQGESSPVLELADGRYITVRVDNITEKTYTPFEEAKPFLQTRWTNEQQAIANKKRANGAIESLKAGEKLEVVAKTFGARVETFNNLKRASTPTAPLTLPALRQIYDASKSEGLQLAIQDGYLIAEVTSVELPEVTADNAEVKTLIEETQPILPQETMAQYINTMGERYKVQVNDRVLKQLYGASDVSH